MLLAMIVVVGCETSNTPSPAPASAPPAKKEPVLYTGKSCMSQMAGMAARWQADALPYHMESTVNPESNGQGGKATVWQAMFASQRSRTYRVYTCSGSVLPDAPPRGVTATPEAAFSPNVPQLMFQSFVLHTDSDEAFKIAQDKGGAKLLEKDANQPVVYLLDWDSKNKALLWVVVYGTSMKDSRGAGVIDAGTGKFLRAGAGSKKS
jgi:hypothetical protein